MTSQAQTANINRFHTVSSFRHFIQFALFGILAALLFCGCGSEKKPSYDAGYNGQTIYLKTGEPFKLNMIVNVLAGGKWEIVELDQSIVAERGHPRARGDVVIGGLPRVYSYRYMFQAVRPGTTKLRMELLKPGEKDPLDTFTVTLVVQ